MTTVGGSSLSVAKEPSAYARPRRPAAVLAAAGLLAASGQVTGEEPSFDCAKADGAVERLICADPGLAALDRKLAEVYAAALRQFENSNYEDPRPFQRGWVKGRNDCWKAEDVRACTETAYRHRIAELQVAYGAFTVPAPINYDCGGFDLATVFYAETDPPTVVLTPIGEHEGSDQVLAFLTPAASGSKYEGANVLFWEHHGEAMLTWFGKETNCKVR